MSPLKGHVQGPGASSRGGSRGLGRGGQTPLLEVGGWRPQTSPPAAAVCVCAVRLLWQDGSCFGDLAGVRANPSGLGIREAGPGLPSVPEAVPSVPVCVPGSSG